MEAPEMMEQLTASFIEGRSYLLGWLDANGYLYKGEAGNALQILSLHVWPERRNNPDIVYVHGQQSRQTESQFYFPPLTIRL